MRSKRANSTDAPCVACAAHSCAGCMPPALTRRGFLHGAGTVAASSMALPALPAAARAAAAGRQEPIRIPLRVQPVLVYETPARRKATSWRSWGGIMTEQDATAEQDRIRRELNAMAASAGFPLEILPLAAARDAGQASAIAAGKHDVLLMYAAGGGVRTLEALTAPGRWTLMFLRHRSGPVYLYYEIAHPRYLRKTVDEYGQPGMTNQDVVVDSYDDVLVRLRGLYGLRNALGKRIVAVGGASGWGAGGRQAPDISRNLWKMDIVTVPYPDLGERIKKARLDAQLVRRARAQAGDYLKQRGVTLETSREFVDNSFLLTEVFHQLLDENATDAITINNCMGTIMPMSETTACLPLSLLNDEGYMAFCESDFVVVPSGVLLHYISGKPVFLNDPTHPHHGVVTIAHCTAPRKLDGQNYENARILTHFESDYGAAPKVEMRKGQRVTNLIPDFACKKWVGFEGEVVDNPFLPICRSQTDISIKGDTNRVLDEMRGFHWMTSYGSYLDETGYALKKLGVDWVKIA